MYMVDLDGNVRPLNELPNEDLQTLTQRGIDTVRRQADDDAYAVSVFAVTEDTPQAAGCWSEVHEALTKPLYDRMPASMKAMVDECNRRGIAIDLTR